MKFHLVVGMAATMFAACSKAPVFTLTNHSTSVLTNIVVSGDGFAQRIDRLEPGSDSKFTVHPADETGVRLAFEANGRLIETAEAGYVRGKSSYRVNVNVAADLSTSVTSQLTAY